MVSNLPASSSLSSIEERGGEESAQGKLKE